MQLAKSFKDDIELPEVNRDIHIDDNYISMVSSPYFENCRYIKSADMFYEKSISTNMGPKMVRLDCEFSIQESCYIQSTGHFNAVEFIMCANQIGYIIIAKIIELGLIKHLTKNDNGFFLKKQLPDILILKVSSSFRSEINPKRFNGTGIAKNFRKKGNHLIFSGDLTFKDNNGGTSTGDVLCCVRDCFGDY